MIRRSLPVLVATIVLATAGCGGDDGGGGGSSGEQEVVRGTGYELTTPESWNEATETAREQSGQQVDLAVAAPPEDGFATNVNVVRQDAPPNLDLETVVEQARSEIQQITGGRDPGSFEDSTLADEPSKTITYDAEQQGRDLRFRQEVALHDGGLYVVTFTTTQAAADKDADTGEAILESWRWR